MASIQPGTSPLKFAARSLHGSALIAAAKERLELPRRLRSCSLWGGGEAVILDSTERVSLLRGYFPTYPFSLPIVAKCLHFSPNCLNCSAKGVGQPSACLPARPRSEAQPPGDASCSKPPPSSAPSGSLAAADSASDGFGFCRFSGGFWKCSAILLDELDHFP